MFYDNLKAECEKQGFKLTPIVLECGGTKGIIGGWKNGAAPRSDIVMKLAVRLNVPTDYLLFGTNVPVSKLESNEQELLNIYQNLSVEDRFRVLGRAETLAELAAERAAEQEKKEAVSRADEPPALEEFALKSALTAPRTQKDTIKITYFDYSASAGTGLFLDEAKSEEITVLNTFEAQTADYAIPVRGDSMEDEIHDGDIVLVESCPCVRKGEVGIFLLDGEVFIKEYGGDCLISYNEKYKPVLLRKYEVAACLGRVLGIAQQVIK